jgi:hypothetical protein
VPIMDRDGRSVAALSVGTISSRLSPDRLPTVVELLKREATAIGGKINPFDPTLRRPAQSLARPNGPVGSQADESENRTSVRRGRKGFAEDAKKTDKEE